MRSFYVLTFLFSFQLFSFGQLQYSLDSIYQFNSNREIIGADRVTDKDSEGFWLAISEFGVQNGAITGFPNAIRARTLFPDKFINSSSRFRCSAQLDTCVLSSFSELNEFGDPIDRISNSFDFFNGQGAPELILLETTTDSTILFPNGRLQSAFEIEFDALTGERNITERVDYFYKINGELDSILTFVAEDNDFILLEREIFTVDTDECSVSVSFRSNGSISGRNLKILTLGDRLITSSGFLWSLIDGDTVITGAVNSNITDNVFTRTTELLNPDSSLRFGLQVEEILLDDGISPDSITIRNSFDRNDPYTFSSSEKYFYTTDFSSTENSFKSDLIEVFPNPAIDQINIQPKNGNLIDLDIENYQIFDVYGRSIQKGNLSGTSIELNSISNGNYYIRFNNGIVKQVIIQK